MVSFWCSVTLIWYWVLNAAQTSRHSTKFVKLCRSKRWNKSCVKQTCKSASQSPKSEGEHLKKGQTRETVKPEVIPCFRVKPFRNRKVSPGEIRVYYDTVLGNKLTCTRYSRLYHICCSFWDIENRHPLVRQVQWATMYLFALEWTILVIRQIGSQYRSC